MATIKTNSFYKKRSADDAFAIQGTVSSKGARYILPTPSPEAEG